MIFARPNHIPIFVLERLRVLFELLKERKNEFETFAGWLKNKSLKRTVLSLAQECNQYAQELLSQLETMTGNMEQATDNSGLHVNSILLDEEAILQSCQLSEKKMIMAYRTILNEPILQDNLRNLLRNQLNGIACAFTQIKLLNASLYHHG